MLITSFRAATVAACLLVGAGPVAAQDWFVRVGAHTVDPKSNSGTLAGGALSAKINSDTRPTIAIGRFLNDNWAVELLGATPFEHQVKLNGAAAVNFKHLPPTATVQYYFGSKDQAFRPFVGAGVNYTWTYDEKTRGPLEGTRVGIENSWGLAGQVGVQFALGNGWELVGDMRWMDIDAKVKVNGAGVGKVAVDPRVYGLYIGRRF